MSDTRPVQLAQAMPSVSPGSPNQRPLPTDSVARFRHALNEPSSASRDGKNPAAPDANEAARRHVQTERHEPISLAAGVPAMVGSLHYALPLNQTAAQPGMTASSEEAVRLIEQATSVLMERAARVDASRFIVSLDHAIVGGASAEFIRDGAFLHVRLLARNDAAYRSMWTHRAELEERLGTSTGLVTRVEIIEGYGDGRSA